MCLKTKLIELHDVFAGYDNNMVLENVNLSISRDEFVGIIGPNGGGKTTLLKVILNERPIIKGSMKTNFSPEHKKPIGYLPQYSNVDLKFPITVSNVIAGGIPYKSWLRQQNRTNIQYQISKTLNTLGITDLSDHIFGKLSGGQRQKVLLGRA
ncbi:ATP-binding cassette domain-containing protein, partial [Bacteroidales bacterium]|nr:ATP-binding cassette domain-containing protein [Bacteroidales bacterium]